MSKPPLYKSPASMLVSGGAVNSITIPNLAGIREYRLKANLILSAATTDTWILLRLNSDSGSNYSSFEWNGKIGAGTPGTDLNGNPGGQTGMNLARTIGAAQNDMSIDARIWKAKHANVARFKSENFSVKDGSSFLIENMAGFWTTIGDITSMTLVAVGTGTPTFYGEVKLYDETD